MANTITVYKVEDICLSSTRYEIHKNGTYYSSNMSRENKNKEVEKFRKLGYTILNGKTLNGEE